MSEFADEDFDIYIYTDCDSPPSRHRIFVLRHEELAKAKMALFDGREGLTSTTL